MKKKLEVAVEDFPESYPITEEELIETVAALHNEFDMIDYGVDMYFIAFETLDELNFHGEAELVQDEGYAECTLSSDLSTREEVMKTIIHEMAHINQLARGDLSWVDGNLEWKSETYDCEYDETPWEVEAIELEEALFDEWYRMNAVLDGSE